jgi:hypothetical protein
MSSELQIAIEKDEFGRMICTLAGGGKEATVTAPNAAEAAEGLALLTRAVPNLGPVFASS